MEFHHYTDRIQRNPSKMSVFCCYRDLLKTNAVFTYLFYFLSLSCVGFAILKSLDTRTQSFTPKNIDLFFTSVSAATVSSMSVVEMEVFSNAQLLVMTVMMFVGGEVFTSMARLQFKAFNTTTKHKSSPPNISIDQIQLTIVAVPDESESIILKNSENDSNKFLGYVLLGYLLVIQVIGIVSVLIYFAVVSSARNVLRSKGLKTSTFAVFAVVSTFSNCGFLPTNENMVVFIKNSGLLFILIPQILLGNTLFPCGLRLVIWMLGKKYKKEEAESVLKETGFYHLLPTMHSWLLAATVLGILCVSFVLFSCLEWDTAGLNGLNAYQKVVAIIFQCANARYSGETIIDLSTLSSAILVFFTVIMYIPPYTSFLPVGWRYEEKEKTRNRVVENIVFSQLSYLAIFIVMICITERKSIKDDPLNFSVLNIILEVISAYGNVGLTTGYSCGRMLKADPKCVDKMYGLSGKFSDGGKIMIIVVMFMGRLKQFNMNGGQAWKLL